MGNDKPGTPWRSLCLTKSFTSKYKAKIPTPKKFPETHGVAEITKIGSRYYVHRDQVVLAFSPPMAPDLNFLEGLKVAFNTRLVHGGHIPTFNPSLELLMAFYKVYPKFKSSEAL